MEKQEEIKKDILSDEKALKLISIYLFFNFNATESKDDIFTERNYNNYDFFNWYLFINKESQELGKECKNIAKQVYNDTLLDKVYQFYRDIRTNDAKSIIYSLSRLLYLQDKFKNSEIGQLLDKQIKQAIEYIETTDNDYIENKEPKDDNLKALKEYNSRIKLYLLSHYIPMMIKTLLEDKTDPNITTKTSYILLKKSFKEFYLDAIKNNIKYAKNYKELDEEINKIINDTLKDVQFNAFKKANSDKIEEIRKTTKQVKNDEEIKALLSVKDKYEKSDITDKKIEALIQDDFITGVANLMIKYETTDDFKALDQTNEDVKKWRNKADLVLNDIINNPDESKKDSYDLNYFISKLAYNDKQVTEYKIKNTIKETKKSLTPKQLKEKYKDVVLLEDNETLDYNRKWAIIDTSKVNTNIINMRESLAKKVNSNTDITERKIKELENKPKPTKKDLEQIKELKDKLLEQQQDNKTKEKELQDLKDDRELLYKQIGDTTEPKQVKSLSRKLRQYEKKIKEKESELNNNGVTFQMNLEGKLVHEKKIKKDTYKLLISQDYDIQNFNNEGRNFLFYIPNINNIRRELDDDFITIDIDNYLDFTGRPNGNVSRIRRNLFNTLKEMRKENYNYSFIDEKGQLQEGSLILIGDIKSTEYKGKATIKVQLGATFKDNIKQAFIKNQIANINKNVFKLGQGNNKKSEAMAKEIFLYLSRLARTEAKKGMTGKYTKDLHLDTIITYLAELDLIKYNPNEYNKSVKEPLETALNVGTEEGLFTYKTNAFKYYDDIIYSSRNNGANVKDKITNFETGKDYGIRFTIDSNMLDLESNNKAHKTYLENQKKYKDKSN